MCMGPGQPCQPPDGSMEPGDWRPGVFVSLAAYTLYTPHADVRLPLLTCSSSVSLLKRSQPWQIRQQRQCCCINCPTGTPSGSSGRSFPQCLGPPRWSARARSRVWKKKEKKNAKKASRRGQRTGCLSSGHPSISDLSDKSDLLSEMRSGRRSPFRFVESVAICLRPRS